MAFATAAQLSDTYSSALSSSVDVSGLTSAAAGPPSYSVELCSKLDDLIEYSMKSSTWAGVAPAGRCGACTRSPGRAMRGFGPETTDAHWMCIGSAFDRH